MPVYNARWVELWSGATAAGWALYVAIMPGTFAHMAQWSSVARWGTNNDWALVAGCLGMFQAVSALLNLIWGRFLAASFMFFVYTVLADGIQISVSSPGVVLYAGWALSNLVSVMRVLRRRK